MIKKYAKNFARNKKNWVSNFSDYEDYYDYDDYEDYKRERERKILRNMKRKRSKDFWFEDDERY